MIRYRGIERADRQLLAALLGSLPAFSDDERAVALELVDHRLGHPGPDDYRFILALSTPDGAPDALAGYVCYGRTPMTESTYDLYWIATAPARARAGVASGLRRGWRARSRRAGGGLVRVETSSREGHGAAVRFYEARGFTRTATIADFYAPGDDLIISPGAVRHGAEADVSGDDERALQDVPPSATATTPASETSSSRARAASATAWSSA